MTHGKTAHYCVRHLAVGLANKGMRVLQKMVRSGCTRNIETL